MNQAVVLYKERCFHDRGLKDTSVAKHRQSVEIGTDISHDEDCQDMCHGLTALFLNITKYLRKVTFDNMYLIA